MQSSYRTPFRGMQVHAVPDADRAIDASGRKLPWGYDADPHSTTTEKREPVEKGPFGRSVRRSRSGLSRSRSRTAEPRREEDRIRAEQLAAEDAVFGSLRKKVREDDGSGGKREALGEVDVNAVSSGAQAGAGRGKGDSDGEATEVMLYGFGEELQWAAIDFYERVSAGNILEDYDRLPSSGPGANAITRSLTLNRAHTPTRSLGKAALRKKNTFAGGYHWIKVTFSSRGAAELACARSPHIVKGYLVYAEPYQGRGPGKDEAIPASQAGARIDDPILPTTFATTTQPVEGSPNGSSTTTATSATATQSQPQPPPFEPITPSRPTTLSQPHTEPLLRHRQPRIPNATPATVHPASAAILPKQPKQSWSQWAGTSEVIGSSVPKRDDGQFDWEKASLYWKVFWLLDSVLGTDLTGLRGD